MSDDLDSLFAAAPASFIEERRRIAAALKGAGRKDEAKAVEKIPRPSVAVWAVNQLARRDPQLVRRLGAITDRLKVAAGPEYGAAAAEHRQVLGELRDRASDVLAGAGHEVGPHLVQRVVTNLRAGAASPETRVLLEQGRVQRDLQEQEVASLFGTAAAALDTPAPNATKVSKVSEPSRPGGAKAGAEAKAAARTAAAAKAEEHARAKQIAAAERDVKRLRADADNTQKDVERAKRAVADAREALEAAEERLTAARADADDAARALARAEADRARLGQR